MLDIILCYWIPAFEFSVLENRFPKITQLFELVSKRKALIKLFESLLIYAEDYAKLQQSGKARCLNYVGIREKPTNAYFSSHFLF